jgi:aspartyl-tRNA(Asn)/glutamyl-tRNA(Gln) amidotransferase subunit A
MNNWPTIEEIALSVTTKKQTAVEQVERALKFAEEYRQYNALISTTSERALERAEMIDERVREGTFTGKLAGVPFAAKDNFLAYGADTTAGSNMLRGFDAPYQATAIELLEAEGAICIGKANLDAFAHGGSTENSDFGVTLNPVDPTKVPGGSSGGSATAVALGIVPFALGTDTGGSCREPASFCGVVGYKPTYGLVSRYGVVAMASSTDVIGLLTRNAYETGLILDIIAGKDAKDATSVDRQVSYRTDKARSKPLRVGVIREFMGDGVASEVRSSIESSIHSLEKSGCTISEISIPAVDLALAAYYIIVPAEISSNLSRYDGQRYGFSADGVTSLDDSYSLSRGSGFGAEAKRRIMLGTYVLSSGYYDAYFKKAAKVRTKLIEEFNTAFKDVDVLIGPTAPMTAPKIGEFSGDPLAMYLLDVMTVPVNLVGVPAISVPLKGTGMPIGLQIIGKKYADSELLSFSSFVEGVV